MASPLAEGRGLKYLGEAWGHIVAVVAPRRGAWIEICEKAVAADLCDVAPRRGAWIEIRIIYSTVAFASSPLAEGRGLKSLHSVAGRRRKQVAPRRGAWIEINDTVP